VRLAFIQRPRYFLSPTGPPRRDGNSVVTFAVCCKTSWGDFPNNLLTNLTQLTVDTSWWTRYRDDSHNPDLDPTFAFPQAVPTLGVNQHTATSVWWQFRL
jgi:hypothetical protein